MGEKRKKRPPAKIVQRMEEMRDAQHKDITKGVLGVVLVIILVLIKTILEYNGVVTPADPKFSNFLLLLAMGLAIVTGSASIDYVKKGKEIQRLCNDYGLSETEAKELGLL